jgi:hypothetical protein
MTFDFLRTASDGIAYGHVSLRNITLAFTAAAEWYAAADKSGKASICLSSA